MTNSDLNRDSAVMISSTMPSTKYSCSASPLMFWKGSTAIEGLSAAIGVQLGGSLAAGAAGSDISVTSPMKRTPLRGEGADQPLGCAVVAERPTHRVDTCGQG